MKNEKSKKAFTMIEVIFVIVIIGILAAVAIPRLAASRDDAEITKAKVLIASVRNSLAMERQKRILRGEFKPIIDVGDGLSNTGDVFGNFYDAGGDTGTNVLEYPIRSELKKFKWARWNGNLGIWHLFCLNEPCTRDENSLWFHVQDGKFECIDQGYATESHIKCSTFNLSGTSRK